ncbi:hypothetical protein [Hymenobacter terricola]|uniref:hypothetical protein n=1 Tax=Hymenobacter terricola TaxID=2819236 RepID=UPI001B317361|nr:hypothetical protein [Hymenobacter terricola]
MKTTFTLVALLGAAWLLVPQPVQAQCHFVHVPSVHQACCHHRDSCAVQKPFVPGRWAVGMGLLGISDR